MPPSIGLSISLSPTQKGAVVANQGGAPSTAGQAIGLLLALTKAS